MIEVLNYVPIGVRLMAQRTQVVYVDDIDGSEAEGTVRLGFGGADPALEPAGSPS